MDTYKMFKCTKEPQRNSDNKRIGEYKMEIGLDQNCKKPSEAYSFEGTGKCQKSGSSNSVRVIFHFFHPTDGLFGQ
jgi:hypothetical protein